MDWTALAQLFTGLANGRMNGKILESNAASQQNSDATSRYQALVNANRLQNVEMPDANASQVQRGTLMSTWKPMSITAPAGVNIPTISGGPSMTPEFQQMGSELVNSALKRQLGGNKLDMTTFPSNESLGLDGGSEGSNWLDKLISGGGTAASLIAALRGGASSLGGGATAATATNSIYGSGLPGAGMEGLTDPISTAPMPWETGGADTASKIKLPGFGGGTPGASVNGLQSWMNEMQLNGVGLGPNPFGDGLENTTPGTENTRRLTVRRRA
jgi:hypothetical protein